MSPASDQLFNTWFPAIVGDLVIGILAAALWDILRRKTWLFLSRYHPGLLKQVGLDDPIPSRTAVEEKQREEFERLSTIFTSQMIRTLEAGKSSMTKTTDPTAVESSNSANSSMFSNSGATNDLDIEAQTGINPLYTPTLKPITFTATAYFLDDTPHIVIRRVKTSFQRYARGTVKRWKFSIVLQASLPVDPCLLAEIGELAKDCMYLDNRCTFQLGNWAILYYNAGEVHFRILTEGDVPVNVEARWQEERTGITMCGLYLNGAQVKVATKRTSTTLRSAGPAAQGAGDLDELHLPIEGVDVPGEDSLIYATKVVEADGISLIVRSEAGLILPPRKKSSLKEIMWDRLQWISLSAMKLIKSLLKVEDRQPETTFSGQVFSSGLKLNFAHFELLAEHWKGVLETELLDSRKGVLYYLQNLPVSGIVECVGPQPSHFFTGLFIRDQYYLQCWQRGLQDLNEVILFSNSPQNMNGSLPGTHISIRGGIKFLLGDFEGALQDFDLAYNLNTGGYRSTVLLERALVKCMLARYSDAMQDTLAVIAINPNLSDIQELQTCLQQILYRLSFRRVQCDPLSQRSQLSGQHNSVPIIPDLLTGDEWYPAHEDAASIFGQPENRVTRALAPPSDDLTNSRDHLLHARTPRRSPSSPYRLSLTQRDRSPNPSRIRPQGFKGARQRNGVRRYLVEIRPPTWKRTIWLGTYSTDREAAGAWDVGVIYMNKKTKYNFPDLEGTFPPLPSQLRLDNPDDSEEIKTFVQKEAREAARKVKSLPPTETSATSTVTTQNVATTSATSSSEEFSEHRETGGSILIPLDDEWVGPGGYSDNHSGETSLPIGTISDDTIAGDPIADFSSSDSSVANFKAYFSNFLTAEVGLKKNSSTGRAWTSGKLEHFPLRHIEAMRQSRSQYSDQVELDIKFSKLAHWSDMTGLVQLLSEEEEMNRENRKFLENLRRTVNAATLLTLDQKNAEGGQANIYTSRPPWMDSIPQKTADLPQRSVRASLSVPFSLLESVDIMYEVAINMFSRGLVHLDLKPTNILLPGLHAGYFPVKLADFGVAKAKMSRCKPVGTTGWKAPEVFEAADRGAVEDRYKNCVFMNKCDVFSFGIMCSEILTGHIPFEEFRERDNLCKCERLLSGVRPTLPSGLYSDLKMLIEKCWHDDPRQRPDFIYIFKELGRIRMNLGTISVELGNAGRDKSAPQQLTS